MILVFWLLCFQTMAQAGRGEHLIPHWEGLEFENDFLTCLFYFYLFYLFFWSTCCLGGNGKTFHLIYLRHGQAIFSKVAFIKKIESPFYNLSLRWVNKQSINDQLLTLQVWISCLGFWRVKCHCNPLKKLPTWAESASRNTTQLSIGSPPVKNPPSTTTVHRMLDFSTRSLSTVMV